jgi:hypothetical protein
MLLKVVFDKTAFKTFKISNNFKTLMKHFKTTKNPEDFKNLKKKIHEPKASRLLANVCNFQKEKKILWYGLKIYRKSIAWTKYFYSL